MGSITFLSADMLSAVPYSSLIRDILGFILWILFAEYVYYLVLNAFRSSHSP